MSFGFSASDSVLLVQLAHRTFRNCLKAGDEYAEIACEVRCLYSVLRTLRTEAQNPESKIFKQDPARDIYTIASDHRVKERLGAGMSSLSLSTFAANDKVVWQDFRRQLRQRGYGSQSLARHKHILIAYMLQLD
ncbi:hypothetical protein DL95DRAFT_329468, partial [Leptodontidium sp. 2 PMI_412]